MTDFLYVGIFGTTIKSEHLSYFKRLLDAMLKSGATGVFYQPFAEWCFAQNLIKDPVETFSSAEELKKRNVQFLISIGGDGTFLDSIPFIHDSKIPVAGLNFGTLGFLTLIDAQHLEKTFEDLCSKNYDTECRSLLNIRSENDIPEPFALNDIVFRSEKFGLLHVDVFVDGKFLNTYFGDGLIISTPTGSTAYNLSCGGPILLPENQNFILTPIASHTLTVRPLVIPDTSKIEVRMTGNESRFLTTLDSRRFSFQGKQTFFIEKAPFPIHTIRLKNQPFFDTIRTKLMWGQDKRKPTQNVDS
ncbi:MAG: NAD(+)/NADH kinase [Bacteroidales bacterium]|nr:NAD(+)/NADH kinase [Bacteroidales bacterium]